MSKTSPLSWLVSYGQDLLACLLNVGVKMRMISILWNFDKIKVILSMGPTTTYLVNWVVESAL